MSECDKSWLVFDYPESPFTGRGTGTVPLYCSTGRDYLNETFKNLYLLMNYNKYNILL